MPTDEIANMWVQYKFNKTKVISQVSRLKMICSIGFMKGPMYIKVQLKMIELEK